MKKNTKKRRKTGANKKMWENLRQRGLLSIDTLPSGGLVGRRSGGMDGGTL
jgi:hypothetical protein